jgi:hypothetical protein
MSLLLLLICGPLWAAPPLRALLVGGGPNPSHNQVAIESNIRYVYHLLPPKTFTRVLFTDGDPQSANVLYEDASGNDHYRVPHLPAQDGPSRLDAFDHEFQTVTQNPGGSLLFYFTGHGGPGANGYDNNEYDLWGGDRLTVQHLAGQIDSLPSKAPIVVVMVECFSGGFGNLLFQGGDPTGPVIPQDLCGFFASVPSREAAGCTPEVNEADYHDFTSYFFAALSGKDRLGHTVTGADYNHNGQIGMDEAYTYALIHDISIDTPTCTSDIFLRRFVTTPDSEVFATPFSKALGWSTPCQKAALTVLSKTLGYRGEGLLSVAYAALMQVSSDGGDESDTHQANVIRFVRVAKSVILAHTLQMSGSSALQARYASLVAAEARNPLTGH